MKGPGVGKDSSEQRAKSEEGKMSASTPQSEPPPLNESLPPASKEDESSFTSTETQVGFAERCHSSCVLSHLAQHANIAIKFIYIYVYMHSYI